MPSPIFLIAIIGTQIVAGIITLIGPDVFEAVPIGAGWTFGVLGVSLLMFMLLDIVKVYTFKFWSFELTAKLWPSKARKEKLAKKQARKIVEDRVNANFHKVRRAARVINAIGAFQNPGSQEKPVIVVVKSDSESTIPVN
ncbi:hypothetical protein HDV01_001567 [Terramyces sp. JEL0728]|nr:hypothetical protein HDV01_001567 [Terramyces sp. JEL0728]